MTFQAALVLALTATRATGIEPSPSETPCSPTPLFEGGRVTATVCTESPGAGLTVLDLGDGWTPRIFSEAADGPRIYGATFVALANERIGQSPEWEGAARDRYFELFGIFPSLGVVRRRLLEEDRHACHAAVDDEPLRSIGRTLAAYTQPPATPAGTAARRAALSVAQRHLACEGLLGPGARDGSFDVPTGAALAAYQRRHMLPSPPVIDAETRRALLTSSRELDFRTLLRVLRERVVDATGLIEDGSARNAWEPVLGRFIDSAEYRPVLRAEPLEGGAPDLIAPATEAAAMALGWTSPEAAAAALASGPPARIAVRLPPVPPYHARVMRLRVEVDRGDVWASYPLDAEGRPRPSPVKNRPTLTLLAETATGDVPLARWPTTIGAWKPEKLDDGSDALRYKASPVGRRYWRDLVAAPAWFPPPTTPDRGELVRRRPDGRWAADQEAVGPGYRSAYGLVALLHHRAVDAGRGRDVLLVDAEIRTHGSGNYRSILRGSSHGCHRLFNHLALRLGSFLLAHRTTERHGIIQGSYARKVPWKGRVFDLRADTRGYGYELVPPIVVDVLPGRNVRSRVPSGSPEVPPADGDRSPKKEPAPGPTVVGALAAHHSDTGGSSDRPQRPR